MAVDDNVEEKNIAKLDFEVEKALNSLLRVQKQVTYLDELSEKSFKNIGKNFSSSFKVDSVKISSSGIEKQLANINKLSQSKAESLKAQLIKIENKKNAELEVLDRKRLNKIEERNQQEFKSTETLGDKIANYAKTYLIYQGFNALKSEAKELVNEMVNVESQMVQIDRVLNDSSLNIDDYRDKLINLAYEYGNSFENVADITLRLAQAGYDADVALALTEKTLLALNTAELNATQATDDMVAVMAQWGLITNDATKDAEAYGDIIDKINIAADNFPTTSEDIMNALKKTSSAFNIAGADIDETIALIVAAEKASQRGGKAIGTALSNISQQLKETSRIDIAEDLGISFFTDETKSEYKDLTTILGELSNKMQQLKDEGKESSVEMQQLLSVFTVFRRNIGSSLLGEMDGEDSTYQQVLDLLDSQERMGYSLRENAKYMNTVEAAQAQLNATILELKTSVWEGGVEDVYRSMLLMAGDVAESLKILIDNFGAIPTAIGAATLAMSAFNKQAKLQVVYNKDSGLGIQGAGLYFDNLKQQESALQNVLNGVVDLNDAEVQGNKILTEYINKVGISNANTKDYIKVLKQQTLATKGLEIATLALNTALSLGLSMALAYFLEQLDYAIHHEEKLKEKLQETADAHQEETDKIQKEAESLETLIDKYEELSNAEGGANREDLKDLQKEINELLGDEAKYVDVVNGKYDEQLNKLREKRKELLTQEIASKQQDIRLNQLANRMGNINGIDDISLEGILNSRNMNLRGFKESDYNTQKEILEEYRKKIQESIRLHEEAGYGVDHLKRKLEEVNEILADMEFEGYEDSVNEVNELMAEKSAILFAENVKNAEDYENAVKAINEMPLLPGFTGTLEEQRELLLQYIEDLLPQFQEQLEATNGSWGSQQSIISDSLTNLDELNAKYVELNNAQKEYNTTGHLTSATLQSLIDNNLLQYLDLSSGKLRVNTQDLLNQAEAVKVAAIQQLQNAAATDLEQIALGNLESISPLAKAAIAQFGNQATQTGNQSQTAAGQISQMAIALDAAQKAAKDKLGEGVDVATYQKQANAVINTYMNAAKSISKIDITSSKYKSAIGSGSRAATKTFEEQSQERVKIFKQEIDDLESLEKAWVNKYKKLELFSTSDLKFITHQRINRYNQYLNEINALTGISEKDRADLIKEYSSKRQEAELEYFDLLKTQLEEQIDALEEANDAKIKLIEDEADAQIAALKKVEDENDRIKQKQEYEAKRNELLYGDQGIEYWSQRTGAEAKKALLEAQKELEELDEEWNEKKEEWTLEEQIEEIENARDAQIKAIEDAQETQIKAWQAAYDEQVRLYAETGQIIYDNSIINAGYLYNAYMDNFVSPLNSRLREISSAITAADNAATAVGNKVNSVNQAAKSGTTQTYGPTREAQDLNTTLANLNTSSLSISSQQKMKENVVRNLFNNRIGVGKFHDGGIVGGSREALALLKPNEVVLKPDWAAGLNKLVARINQGENIVNNTSNSTNVVVEGNMVNIEADIKKSSDIKELSKEIEDVLKKKLNINK